VRTWLQVALGAALWAAPSAAQDRVRIVDRGPGGSGRAIERTLARPHRLVAPDTGWFRQRRGEQAAAALIVLGRTAVIEGNVNGDVVVVGGDLFVRPGAFIGGRGVAIGGGVYPSAMAVVTEGTESYRDNTFMITRTPGGFDLSYQSLREHASPPLLFPGVYGLRMPTYDRVNGVTLPFGPALSFWDDRAEIHGLVSYRSDLGAWDPALRGSAQLSRRVRAELSLGRGSESNDSWIWSNLVNSYSVLVSGTDTRNYYRADRADLRVHRLWEFTFVQVEPFVGAIHEDAWSVGPARGEGKGPWSVFGRTDTLRMRRPNPPVDPGVIASAVAGARADYEREDLRLRLRNRVEANLSSPSEQRFVQTTWDFDAGFPTFGEHTYALEVHWVTTAGDTPPPQRFGYMGGSGTLPFLELLEQGGDELLLVDQRYSIPVPSVRLGLLGEPTLIFRHRLGSAGVSRLPAFEQVIGAGVLLTLLRVELQVDPVRGGARFSAGFSFSR
jgi:hypothetical protein